MNIKNLQKIFLHYMAAGRIWQHAKYSWRVWESVARQASSILRNSLFDFVYFVDLYGFALITILY